MTRREKRMVIINSKADNNKYIQTYKEGVMYPEKNKLRIADVEDWEEHEKKKKLRLKNGIDE